MENEDNNQTNNKQTEKETADPPQMNINSRYESLSWPCTLCSEVLSFKQTFVYHMLYQHNTNVFCKQCKKVYETNELLETHNLSVHS